TADRRIDAGDRDSRLRSGDWLQPRDRRCPSSLRRHLLGRVWREPHRNGDDRTDGREPDGIFWRAEGRGLEGIGDNQLMIPPLPTINDSIELLTALSDPEKYKALLVELK